MAKTTDKALALEDLKIFKEMKETELQTLERVGEYVEDVLDSIKFVEEQKGLSKETLSTFKKIKTEALKVKGALPVLIAFQKAFVKCGEQVIKENLPKRKGRSRSPKASRATTSTTKKSTKQEPKKRTVKK